MTDSFLKLGEVAEMFNVSRSTVWRWHAERGLKVLSVGGVTRVRESDEVDVLGFPNRGEYTPILEDAVFRTLNAGTPPAPILISPRRVQPRTTCELARAVWLAVSPFRREHAGLGGEGTEAVR